MKDSRIGEILFTLCLAGVLFGAFVEARGIPGSAIGNGLSPSIFPVAIAVLALLLLAGELVKIILSVSRSTEQGTTRESGVNSKAAASAWLLIVLLLAGYGLALEVAGYVITTSLFVFVVIVMLAVLNREDPERLDVRKILFWMLLSVVVSVAIYLLFSLGFDIVLPNLSRLGGLL